MSSNTLQILAFSSQYRDDFKRLNIAWLRKYFVVEPIDEIVLSDPQTSIIEPGGKILLAELNGKVIGTVALIAKAQDKFELSKMAVDPQYQGLGIGRQLLDAAIEAFENSSRTHLFLESNSALKPAIKLYESAGFEHRSPPKASDYARADVYMVYQPKT